MKKTLIALTFLFILSGCQRGCQKMEKANQTSKRQYDIKMYSGGKVVFQDRFSGIVNDNSNSDGFFYFKGDSLIEVSGDYVLKSVKND